MRATALLRLWCVGSRRVRRHSITKTSSIFFLSFFRNVNIGSERTKSNNSDKSNSGSKNSKQRVNTTSDSTATSGDANSYDSVRHCCCCQPPSGGIAAYHEYFSIAFINSRCRPYFSEAGCGNSDNTVCYTLTESSTSHDDSGDINSGCSSISRSIHDYCGGNQEPTSCTRQPCGQPFDNTLHHHFRQANRRNISPDKQDPAH